MCKFVLVLACWSCAVQGQREQTPPTQRQLLRTQWSQRHNPLNAVDRASGAHVHGQFNNRGWLHALRSLALCLVACRPAAAFNLCCPSVGATLGCLSTSHLRQKVWDRELTLDCGMPMMSTSSSQPDSEHDAQNGWEPVLLESENSKQLWVGPAGRRPVTKEPPDGAVAIYLQDDDEVFLTTSENVLHWTTLQALSFLMEIDLEGRVVLDYGCGSGVLTLAASAFGAASATGIDICEYSLRNAEENAELNRCDRQPLREVTFVRAADLEASMADLVLANMLPGPLLSVALDIARCIRADGEVFLTGFKPDSEAVVRQAFSPWFSLELRAKSSAGWMALVGRRNSALVGNEALSGAAL